MKTISRVLLACWIVISAVAPVAARQPDIAAIEKRFGALKEAGDYVAALVELQKLEAAVKARVGTSDPAYAVVLKYFAAIYLLQYKYAESAELLERAAELLERALAIQEKALGPSHPDVAKTRKVLPNVYLLRDTERMLELRKKALGPSHPDPSIPPSGAVPHRR